MATTVTPHGRLAAERKRWPRLRTGDHEKIPPLVTALWTTDAGWLP